MHGRRYEALHRAYYLVGASALAFSFMLLFYQSIGQDPSPSGNYKSSSKVQLENQGKATQLSWLELHFNQVRSQSFSERMGYWSGVLEQDLEASRALHQLAEDRSVADSAPLFPKQFDCTTFVETVIALSRSNSPSEVIPQLLAVRYRGGEPSFENRNHFVEADWIPNNEQHHIVKDITTEVAQAGQAEPRIAERILHRSKWLTDQLRQQGASRSIASVVPETKSVRIQYLSLDELGSSALEKIPSGVVVNFVREFSPKHAVLVSHQGILIRSLDGQILLRHASIGGHIRTESLTNYLDGMRRHNQKAVRWGWLGLNLNQISSSSPDKILRKDSI